MKVSPRPPKVTIGIPTYNRSGYLREAIGSVLEQTYGDFGLTISDNASTDDTSEVAGSFDDSRIVYRRQPENVGLLANHNRLLLDAKTEYVLVLSDDDLLYPRFLETAVRTLDDQQRAGMVHTAFDLVGPAGEALGDGNWTEGLREDTVESANVFLRESMKWTGRVCASTALLRTAAIPAGAMREEDFPAVDFGLWLRMAAEGWDFVFLGQPLAAYRVHGSSQSAAHAGPPDKGSYSHDLRTVKKVEEVKLRFLAEHDRRLGDVRALRQFAAQGARIQILSMVKRRTLARESVRFRRTRFVAESTRVDPTLLLSKSLWRYVAADLVGRGRKRHDPKPPSSHAQSGPTAKETVR